MLNIDQEISQSDTVIINVHTYWGAEVDGQVLPGIWDQANTLAAALFFRELPEEQKKIVVFSSSREDKNQNVAELSSKAFFSYMQALKVSYNEGDILIQKDKINDSLAEVKSADGVRSSFCKPSTPIVGIALRNHTRVPSLYRLNVKAPTFIYSAEDILSRFGVEVLEDSPPMNKLASYTRLPKLEKMKWLLNPNGKLWYHAANILGSYKHLLLNVVHKTI